MSRQSKRNQKKRKGKIDATMDALKATVALEDFRRINLEGQDEGSLGFRRDKVARMLRQAGFQPNASDFRILATTYEAHIEQIRGNGDEKLHNKETTGQPTRKRGTRYYPPKVAECNADYLGYITEDGLLHFVRIRLYDGGLFIRRSYPNNDTYEASPKDCISIDWRINPKGRIYQISSLLDKGHKRGIILLKVPCTEYLEPNWEWTPAYADEIPPKVEIMSPNPLELEPLQRYALLLQTGHKLAKEVLTQLSAGTVEDPKRIENTQKSLKDIVKDDPAMDQLGIASKLNPSVDTSEIPHMITVVYN